MEEEIKRIDKILEIDDDPTVVLFDHIVEEEAKIQSLEDRVSGIQEFVEDAVAMKIDGVDGRNPMVVSQTEPENPQIGDLWYIPD